MDDLKDLELILRVLILLRFRANLNLIFVLKIRLDFCDLIEIELEFRWNSLLLNASVIERR